jgi:hypothetical protein
MRLMTGEDPFSPEHIRQRRAAVLDFVAAAVFTREPGQEVRR